MEIIYVSNLISKKKMKEILETSDKKPLQSIQKFHRLLCQGFYKNNVSVTAISAIPISQEISKKRIWINKREKEENIVYKYIPFINFKYIRQICIMIGTFFMVLKKALIKKKEVVFICDILNTTISFVTLMISKIFKVTCVGIVTDLPEDMLKTNRLNKILENNFDLYVLLTEQMNEKINKKKKPYIVIEGIVDPNMDSRDNLIENKYSSKVCIYAGGLYEKYGVKTLVDAFKEVTVKDAKLHIYGNGELEEYIKNLDNEKIKYFGVVENDKIVEEELKATLLINPRFTHEEYTKYSFPSKNMEYMVSGTPVLTTKLPGIPEEYFEYIYFFEEENVNGYAKKIDEILNKTQKEIIEKGKNAKNFVIKNKNNVIQVKKILKFIKKYKERKI